MREITYHQKIPQDIVKIGRSELIRMHSAIEKKLSTRPELYGMRLRGRLKEYWKLRVGDYRIVYKIGAKQVFILAISHRKDVYDVSDNRL